MKDDSKFMQLQVGSITTQSCAGDDRLVSIRTTSPQEGLIWARLNREQVIELIGNLVELLADLEE